jgi:predicted CoA-binding protein
MLAPQQIRDLLTSVRTIAVVGHSDKPHRTSYQIAEYLRRVGYTVYPVNPTLAKIDGQRCYARLAEIPDKIDIVNVFRRSEYLEEIVEAAISVGAKVVWAQLGVYDVAAARRAEAAGLTIIMDSCIKVEHSRLTGSLSY